MKQKTKRQPRLLSNIYVCGKKSRGHMRPATEFLLSSALTFEITPDSVHFLPHAFNYAYSTWFKFIVIHDTITPSQCGAISSNSSGTYRMFVCNGSSLTRHSVIYIDALAHILTEIETTEGCKLDAKYEPFLKTYWELVACKESKRGPADCNANRWLHHLKDSLNSEIGRHFECMKVVSAGSGTVFIHNERERDKYVVCLNTKSGHYRPTLKDVEFAKGVFMQVVGGLDPLYQRQYNVIAQRKPSKKSLQRIFGEQIAKTKLGLCIEKLKPKTKTTTKTRKHKIV
jgi:hypothetical protein